VYVARSIALALALLTSQAACVINPPAQSFGYAPSVPSGVVVERLSSADLAAILKSEGYGSVTVQKDGNVSFKANGVLCVLYRYDDGDLQLYFGITGITVDPRTINEWNRTRRLSRAYLDADQDPILEADLLADTGLSRETVSSFVKVFVQSVSHFQTYLLENGEAQPASADDAPTAQSL